MKNKLLRKFPFFLCASMFIALPFRELYAEKVILKSGKVIEGRIKEKTDSMIVLEYEGKDIYYETKLVDSIDYKPLSEFSTEDAKVGEDETRNPFEKGLFLGSQRKFSEAARAFEESLSKDPSDSNAIEAAHILEDLRDKKISEDFAQALFEGTLLFLNKRYDAAARSFERAVKLKPDATELYYNLGNLYNAMGQYKLAIPYFEKLLKDNPLDKEALFSIGFSYFSLNEFQRSAEMFERYLALDPADEDAHGFLGASYYALGREDEAMEEFKKSGQQAEEASQAAPAQPARSSFREEGIREIINRF